MSQHVCGAIPRDDGLLTGPDGRVRCSWCGDDPQMTAYHDTEWGFPVTDDRRLFEKICLEGFQSGLSWRTILRKREAFRAAFDGFDVERVAAYGPEKIEALLLDAGIVRHRGKVESTINNAKRMAALLDEHGSFSAYVWRFEPHPKTRPDRMTRRILSAMPTTPESTALSKDLKKRGFTFVGPTTVYAFMQAMGLVNDHLDGCALRPAAEKARLKMKR